MASGNDALKKHHFWILAAAAPVLVLLAIVFLMTGVGGAIDAAYKNITDKENAVKGGNAPGTGMIKALEAQKEVLIKVRGELWKKNWDKQEQFFTWPEAPGGLFDRYNTMKFGTSFRDFIGQESLRENFKPAYAAAYEKLGASIAPTAYKGGNWQNILRWVANWGVQSPESRQLWLVMEDLWIQRAMLQPISIVNKEIARFDLVKPENGSAPPPRERTFRSHVWEVALKVEPRDQAQGGGLVLKGKLKNRTNQLQVLGVGSTMTLKVWFDPKLDLQPFEFRVEGAGVGGGDTIDVPPLPSHVIQPGTDVVEIAKVEQVLDRRTVPIRRLDRLAIGYPSAKDYTKPLLNPSFWPDAAPTDAAASGGGGGGSASGPPPGMEMNARPPGGGAGDPAAGGAGGSATAAGPGRAGGLRLVDVADGNKKRYVEANEQLRRVPVAFTLIVDQMYVNDVLIAYSNSPLRFETVQYHWQRFTDSLDAPAGTDPSNPMGGGYDAAGGGEVSLATSSIGSGLSSSGPPPGMMMPATSSTGGAGSGQFGFGGIPGLGAETLSSVSEAQANSGLIQLTVYGNVTLYERLEPAKKEGDAADPAKAETAPADPAKPMATDPAQPADPAKPMPMTPAPAATDLVKPTTPADPAKPAPVDPTKPDPAKPAPADPAKPVPTTPTPPADPAKPAPPK